MSYKGEVVGSERSWADLVENAPHNVSFIPALVSPSCQRVLSGHDSVILGVATAPNGGALSASWDGTARLWQAQMQHIERISARRMSGRPNNEQVSNVNPNPKILTLTPKS